MREILFRGKRLDNGEWVEGFLVKDTEFYGKPENHTYIINHKHPSGCYGQDIFLEVDPTTVGQYTGLTANDKRIFEGDIIKTHYINTKKNDFVEQVVFHNGRFCALFNFSGNGRMWTNLPDGVSHLPQDKTPYMEWCEVIGNIYDNPELFGVM